MQEWMFFSEHSVYVMVIFHTDTKFAGNFFKENLCYFLLRSHKRSAEPMRCLCKLCSRQWSAEPMNGLCKLWSSVVVVLQLLCKLYLLCRVKSDFD